MRTSKLFIVASCAAIWLAGLQTAVAADDAPSGLLSGIALPDSRPASTPGAEQFPRGTWIFQVDGTFIHPFSGERFEQFVGGQAGVGYYVFDRVSVNFDVPMYWVNQRGPNTFGGGFDLLARWHFLEQGPLTLYADGGAGMLFTSCEVPRGGTHVNFTPQIGLGATWALNDRTYLFGGARYWHLSNAGMEGHKRNPSIDGSVMAYVGVGWRL